MSFDFSQLPFYTPIQNPATSTDLQIKTNVLGVKEVTMQLDSYNRYSEGEAYSAGVGRINIQQDEEEIGRVTLNTENRIHFTFTAPWSKDRHQKVVTLIDPDSISVKNIGTDAWSELKEENFILRSELVRWFALVGPRENPYQHLKASRRKKMKENVKKAKAHFDIKIEKLTKENFEPFNEIYKKEIVARENGIAIFYADLFAKGQKIEGLLSVQAHTKEGEYVGGCIVTPWGLEPLNPESGNKYTTFVLSSFKSSARPFALGYLLDDVVMNIARENKENIYGHGGDPNFWGHEINPGLFSRKVAVGMTPVPAMQIEAFLLTEKGMEGMEQKQAFTVKVKEECENEMLKEKDVTRTEIGSPWKNPSQLQKIKSHFEIHYYGEQPKIQVPEGFEFKSAQ